MKSSYTFGYPDYQESDEDAPAEKPKIYLSPAYHKANQCCYKRPDGWQCYETLEYNEFLDILQPMLERCGFDIMRGPRRTPMSDEYGPDYMYRAIKESNEWGAKVHYVSHINGSTNGPTGHGTEKGFLFMYHPSSANGKKLAELMIKYRKAIYPTAAGRRRGATCTSWTTRTPTPCTRSTCTTTTRRTRRGSMSTWRIALWRIARRCASSAGWNMWSRRSRRSLNSRRHRNSRPQRCVVR